MLLEKPPDLKLRLAKAKGIEPFSRGFGDRIATLEHLPLYNFIGFLGCLRDLNPSYKREACVLPK